MPAEKAMTKRRNVTILLNLKRSYIYVVTIFFEPVNKNFTRGYYDVKAFCRYRTSEVERICIHVGYTLAQAFHEQPQSGVQINIYQGRKDSETTIENA